jgi:hypothetical protein
MIDLPDDFRVNCLLAPRDPPSAAAEIRGRFPVVRFVAFVEGNQRDERT